MPISPMWTIPITAFMLAPSPYTRPPLAWTMSAIFLMLSSNSPRVLGLVTMMPAVSSSMTAATSSGARIPCCLDFIGTGPVAAQGGTGRIGSVSRVRHNDL